METAHHEDKRAAKQWYRAQHAYEHYSEYIQRKQDRYALSFTDLVYVKNFKGGNSTIAEPSATARKKIGAYENMLRKCAATAAFASTLGAIGDREYLEVKALMLDFAALPAATPTKINGFGASFASALLHFYFPNVVPILDKRALNGSGVPGIKVNNQGEVSNMLELYSPLIDRFREELRKSSSRALREIDREWFARRLSSPPFRKIGRTES